MHDEWLHRAALHRNLAQEMGHLGPAPCSLLSQPAPLPATADAQKSPQEPRGTAKAEDHSSV